MFPLLLLFLFLTTSNAHSPSCRNDTCGNHIIAYPFWLISPPPLPKPALNCGYFDLGLVCDGNATLLLPVHSHNYTVSSIDYNTHTISLADVDAVASQVCPRLNTNLTISRDSGLQLTPSDSNVTFLYNCTAEQATLPPSVTIITGCPEQNRSSYVFLDGGVTAEAEEYECDKVLEVPVLRANKTMVGSAFWSDGGRWIRVDMGQPFQAVRGMREVHWVVRIPATRRARRDGVHLCLRRRPQYQGSLRPGRSAFQNAGVLE